MFLLTQQEEERAKKENISPTKLPVVMEAQEPSEIKEEPKPETKEDTAEEPETKVRLQLIVRQLSMRPCCLNIGQG